MASKQLEWSAITKEELMSINEITEGTANKILQRRGEKEKWDENDWDWLRTLTEISQEEWSEIVMVIQPYTKRRQLLQIPV